MTDIPSDPFDIDEVPEDEPEIEVTIPSPAEPASPGERPAV